MSRNSKNAKRVKEAKAWSEQRKNGNKGPATTQKKSKKKKTWHAIKDGKYDGPTPVVKKQQDEDE